MKTRMQYIFLFVTFIPLFILAMHITLDLFEPYFSSFYILIETHRDCFGLYEEEVCLFENVGSVTMKCPSLQGDKPNKLSTITISNPQDVEQEYHTNVYAVFQVEEDRYTTESVCSNTLMVAPNQSESFTCEVDPRNIEGEIFRLQAKVSPEGKACAGFDISCSTQQYLALYCLIPFLVCIPFLGWFVKLFLREEPAEPEPDSDPGDA